MLTPVKAIKGQCEELKQRDKAFNALFSTAVSKVGQPIGAFSNWLNEKTNIQRAMKVISINGLLVHIYESWRSLSCTLSFNAGFA